MDTLDAAVTRILTGQAPVRGYDLTLPDLDCAERSIAGAIDTMLRPRRQRPR